MKTRIHLVVEREDGTSSNIESDKPVTPEMLDAAEDLRITLTTGTRPPSKGLYDVCATAFNTSRDDAKERIVAASYGMSSMKIEARAQSRGSVIAGLVTARRERRDAYAEVVSWMDEEGARRGTSPKNEEAPAWDRYTRAQIAYGYAIRHLEAWLDAEIGT